ncbi:hypothetical protein PHYBOEH_009140 [Phytophthora boehmeriae]|uniref:Palmitoyltransferase n=1 Tax=Phytophthora boehmeriae TaxID=109152 RepID=A0A8T1X4M0_9STRA|nr:hypothetical protein PHYBOEH_009140 [Phytophthora boehmeriae]
MHMRYTVVPLFTTQFAITTLLFVIISHYDPGLDPDTRHQVDQVQPVGSIDGTRTAVTIESSDANASSVKSTSGLLESHGVILVCRDCGRVPVTPNTRHCGRCNKCVPGYDHHCIYLNTCIGTRNYPLFVGLMSCTILLLLTQLIVTGYAISCLLAEEKQHASRPHRAMWLCVLSLLPALELVFLVVLACFHLYIAFLGLTTYEWLYQWLDRRNAARIETAATVTRSTRGSRTSL